MTVAVIFLVSQTIRPSDLIFFFPLICYQTPVELLNCVEDHTLQVNTESKPPKTLPSQSNFLGRRALSFLSFSQHWYYFISSITAIFAAQENGL